MDATTIAIAVLVMTLGGMAGLIALGVRNMSLGQPKGEGYAPGWQVRCPTCGLTVDAGKAGLIRVMAKGTSRQRGRCDGCQKRVWLIVERAPGQASQNHDTD